MQSNHPISIKNFKITNNMNHKNKPLNCAESSKFFGLDCSCVVVVVVACFLLFEDPVSCPISSNFLLFNDALDIVCLCLFVRSFEKKN